ncbi:MAG: hypothetical protein IPI95_05225 [Flavobacteriales bacterium]|nr:hypothetical protein [Flavobacteriales bacterium]
MLTRWQQRFSRRGHGLEKNDREAFHDALGKALEGYFADKFNLGVAEVNAGTIKAKLGGLDEGRTAEAYIALLRDAEMARFAPMENKPQRQTYDEASAIISSMKTSFAHDSPIVTLTIAIGLPLLLLADTKQLYKRPRTLIPRGTTKSTSPFTTR